MKTLYLLRHAKSDWSDPRLSDHDRPLAPRGRKAARQVGRLLALARPRPELVLCSSAVRAQETWAGVEAEMGETPELAVDESLYGADAADLVSRLRRLPEAVAVVLLVGHNPGLEELARDLAEDGDPAARQQLDTKFPTAALATLTIDGRWSELDRGSCYLESVVTPRGT